MLLALMALQFGATKAARSSPSILVDRSALPRSARRLRRDLGGALHAEEGDGAAVALQPLARIDNAGERAWAAEWLAAMLAGEGMVIDPAAKEHLWSALTSLASAPPAERTLTGLAVLLQSQELKQAPSLSHRRSMGTAARC